MADLQTLYRFVLHLVSCLLVVGLVFMISLVLAYPCEAGKEEIVEAEDIIKALRDGDMEVIDCSGCIVEGNLDFFNLPKEMDEQVIIIKRPLNFRKSVFHGRIGTRNPSMELEEQPPVKFLSTVNFVGASFEDHVNFDGAIFEENAYFDGAQFHKMGSFTRATFNKSAGFRSAQFDERSLFTKTVFEGRTDFAVATFNGITFFDKSKFRYIDENKSWRGANFLFTRFNGLFTYFSEAQFNSTARFIGTNFHGPTYFSGSTFENQAWFLGGCRFDDDVSFKGAKFLKKGSITREKQGKAPRAPVVFAGVVFSGNAIFSGVQFNQVAFCEVDTEVDMGMDTIFRKKADFRRATFETLDLQRVIFESDVDFSNADFGERVDFSNVDIERASITLKWDQLCKKEGNEGWPCINIGDALNYGDTRVPKFEWEGVNLSRQRGKYLVTDSQACCDAFVRFLSSLERNFKELDQQKDAETVHFLVQDTKRTRRWIQGTNRCMNIDMSNMSNLSMNMSNFKGILKKPREYLNIARIKKNKGIKLIECCMDRIVCSFRDLILFKYIYGYGVKYRRYVFASILAIFGFALVYMRRDVLWHEEKKKGEIPRLLKITDVLKKGSDGKAVLKVSDRIIKRYMVGLWFSLSVFTKIGYRDVYVKDKYKKTRLAVKFEWFLGYILGALLLINLISRCEPLFRLVTTFI